MKQTKRILALVIAFVMIFCAACPTAFAKVVSGAIDSIYTDATRKPEDYLNGVDKYEFTAEEGASYILDMLDGLLHDVNLNVENDKVLDEWYATVTLKKIDFTSIDSALWTLWNIIYGVTTGDETCIKNFLNIKLIGIGFTGVAADLLPSLDLGDIPSLSADALTDQNNSTTRVCRNVPVKDNTQSSSDLTVLKNLVQFLSDNRNVLKKIATSNLDLGLLGNINLGDTIQPFLDDFPAALKNILYGVLIDGEADEAPSGWTYDAGIQQIVDWLLIDGTGETAETGANSVLGANFDAFLPAIKNQPGAASLTAKTIYADRDGDGVAEQCTMNFYQLVSNAISALLGGMVADMLEGVLLNALDIESTEAYPNGDPAILSDVMFSTIVGAIESLCVACGAPAIVYTQEENSAPIPKIHKLLDWFFNGGGLATFIKIDYNGIVIEDNLVSLLHKVIRILPGLFPLLGISVPDGLTYSTTEMAEQYYDENGTHTYWAYQNYSTDPVEIYIPDPDNYPDDYAYVSNGNTVNTTDPTAPNYYDPALIEDRYVLSNDQIYGALIKIVLNSLVDGCYFPEWADTIPVVGAYALASLAAQYLPENNYFDRLDAYHYQSIGESYTGRVKADAEPLAYTEEVTITSTSGETKTATIPRAAMDIGMSVLAYIIRGWNDFSSVLGYTPETDTTFETYVLEFVLWGATEFMPVLTGKINSSTHRTEAISGATSTFMTQINRAFAGLDALNAQYPKSASQSNVSNIPGLESGTYLFELLDDTLFEIIPMSWLPAWVSDYGSAGVVYDWLLDSVVNFDLQKLISILQTNPTGELATNDTLTVLIRLIDRVLGLVVGGNSILPAENRNVFTTNTSITTLEQLLAGDGSNLATVIERLLYWLNVYIPVLGDTIFPLIFMFTGDTMKDSKYYEGTTLKDPIGNNQITYEQLSNYVASVKADDNSHLFYGDQYYTTKAKANSVAEAIGIENYDADAHTATIDGATKYVVTFPETYKTGTFARNAASYIENGKAVTKRVNRELVHYVYIDDDYRTATSANWTDTQETDANGNVISHSYNYPNITRATAIYDAAKGYRTGDLGEVKFTEGYRTFSTEDYRASNIFYYNRRDDAVDDAEDHLGDIDDYAQKTLPNAYHDWLMYYVKTKLVEKGKYDKNLDGVVDHNDGNPDVPSSAYPFYKTSGSTNEFNYSYDSYNPLTTGTYTRSWSFSYCAPTNVIVAEALAYANETDDDGNRVNDVVFPNNEAQLIVRLALNTLSFDTTQEGCWDALSAANNTTITNFCNSLGLTYDVDNHTISSKAFALFSGSMNSSTTFGKYIIWSGNDTDGWTSETKDISLQPVGAITLGADGVDKVANKIQEAYVDFAKEVYNLTTGLNKNYDNISWRTAKCEDAICSSPNTNTLEFILSLTNEAYYPQGQETGKNKKLNEFGLVVTAYTKSSFDEFQQAYDYGVCLLNQKNAGANLTQSLVTVAYKAILQAYKNLVPFSGKADWTTLENYIAQANAILDGDLGLGDTVDRSVGYTLETLNNLDAATTVAEQFKTLNYEAFDSDYQENVDEQAMILYSVIAGLKFPEGLEPMAIINPAYEGHGDYEIVEGTDYQLTAGGVKYQIITGLAEGQNFVDTFQNNGDTQNIFIATGYTNDGNANKLFIDKADFGYGTGSSINGYVNLIPRFKYYAVLYGDVNGDTRIDGADKTIVDMTVAQGSTETMEKYLQVAADVNFDGAVDSDDIAAINNYYKKTDVTGIDQTGTPSTSWFNATVSD